MIPEKDEVQLVVEGHNRTPLKFGLLREHCVQLPTDLMAKPSVEVIQHHLRLVVGLPTTALDVLVVLDGRELEVGGGSVGQVADLYGQVRGGGGGLGIAEGECQV